MIDCINVFNLDWNVSSRSVVSVIADGRPFYTAKKRPNLFSGSES